MSSYQELTENPYYDVASGCFQSTQPAADEIMNGSNEEEINSQANAETTQSVWMGNIFNANSGEPVHVLEVPLIL